MDRGQHDNVSPQPRRLDPVSRLHPRISSIIPAVISCFELVRSSPDVVADGMRWFRALARGLRFGGLRELDPVFPRVFPPRVVRLVAGVGAQLAQHFRPILLQVDQFASYQAEHTFSHALCIVHRRSIPHFLRLL